MQRERGGSRGGGPGGGVVGRTGAVVGVGSVARGAGRRRSVVRPMS